MKDALNIVVNAGAIALASSLKNLPDILSCLADLDVLTVESNFYTLVSETFCMLNSELEKVK